MYSVIFGPNVFVEGAPNIQMGTHLEKERIKYFVESTAYRQLHDLAGELVEFVRRKNSEQSPIQLLKYIQEMFAEEGVSPSQFKGRIIFMVILCVLIPYEWTDNTCHVGSTSDYRCISEEGLVAGGIGVRQGRQICFFTAVDYMNVSLLTLRHEPSEPRKIP